MSQPLRPTPPPASDISARSAGAVFAQALPAGTELGAYRIVSVLGAGGFGITYLATDTAVGMDMAVKEFLPTAIAARSADGAVQPHSPVQAADYEWGLARFRDEAKTLAKLDHPNIVRVRDFREANRTAYVVMEFIAGETLEARLARTNTLSADELARLLPALWSGVEAVHEAGFLHRDLKPSNIMLRPDGTPVLIDFGAARQALSAHSRSLTAVLSEGYAPYEQYQRDGDQGAWTDVYALGATLYRCVTGEKPVEATRRIDARVKGKPDPLPPASELAAGRYPAPLLAAIDRALATVETERPRSIAEFRAIAESPVSETTPSAATLVAGAPAAPRETASGATLLAGSPAPHAGGETLVAGAPPASAPPRIGARRSLLRWALLTVGIVLLSGGAVAGYVALRDRQAAVEEARRAEDAEKQRQAAEGERRRAAERAAAAAEAEAKAAAVRDLEAGMAASRAKQFDEALRLLAKAIETGKLTTAQHAQALLAKSAAWAGKGNFERALAEADAAVRVDPTSAEALLDRGRIRWHRQQQDAALADFNQALKLDPNSAEAYSLRGIVWFHRRDYDRAIADYTEALRLKPGLADARFNRGLAWQAKGDRAKAIEDFRAALRANPPEELARNARKILESLGVQP